MERERGWVVRCSILLLLPHSVWQIARPCLLLIYPRLLGQQPLFTNAWSLCSPHVPSKWMCNDHSPGHWAAYLPLVRILNTRSIIPQLETGSMEKLAPPVCRAFIIPGLHQEELSDSPQTLIAGNVITGSLINYKLPLVLIISKIDWKNPELQFMLLFIVVCEVGPGFKVHFQTALLCCYTCAPGQNFKRYFSHSAMRAHKWCRCL